MPETLDPVELRPGTLDLRGRILKPGITTLWVNGKPARVDFPKDVILNAWAKLRDRVAAKQADVRLAHPGLGPLSIPFGRIRSVLGNPDTGEVYVAGTDPNPEIATLFDTDARNALTKMGLSIRSDAHIRPAASADHEFVVTRLDVLGADVVDRGAFEGSNIVAELPAGLAAALAASHPHPHSDREHAGTIVLDAPSQDPATPAGQEKNPMSEQKLTEMAAQLAKLEAANADLTNTHKAALAAAEAEKAQLAERVAKLEASNASMLAAAADREAKDDVNALVLAGKATPAQEASLITARKAMGRDEFAKLAASMPVVVAPGERGHLPKDKPKDDRRAYAQGVVQRQGAKAVLESGLWERDAHVAAELLAQHPTDAGVKRIEPRLKLIAKEADA